MFRDWDFKLPGLLPNAPTRYAVDSVMSVSDGCYIPRSSQYNVLNTCNRWLRLSTRLVHLNKNKARDAFGLWHLYTMLNENGVGNTNVEVEPSPGLGRN